MYASWRYDPQMFNACWNLSLRLDLNVKREETTYLKCLMSAFSILPPGSFERDNALKKVSRYARVMPGIARHMIHVKLVQIDALAANQIIEFPNWSRTL